MARSESVALRLASGCDGQRADGDREGDGHATRRGHRHPHLVGAGSGGCRGELFGTLAAAACGRHLAAGGLRRPGRSPRSAPRSADRSPRPCAGAPSPRAGITEMTGTCGHRHRRALLVAGAGWRTSIRTMMATATTACTISSAPRPHVKPPKNGVPTNRYQDGGGRGQPRAARASRCGRRLGVPPGGSGCRRGRTIRSTGRHDPRHPHEDEQEGVRPWAAASAA